MENIVTLCPKRNTSQLHQSISHLITQPEWGADFRVDLNPVKWGAPSGTHCVHTSCWGLLFKVTYMQIKLENTSDQETYSEISSSGLTQHSHCVAEGQPERWEEVKRMPPGGTGSIQRRLNVKLLWMRLKLIGRAFIFTRWSVCSGPYLSKGCNSGRPATGS